MAVLQLVDQLPLVREAELELQQAVVQLQLDREMGQLQVREMEMLLVREQELELQQVVVHLHTHQEMEVGQHHLREMELLLVRDQDQDLPTQEEVENKIIINSYTFHLC